jgi:chitinase
VLSSPSQGSVISSDAGSATVTITNDDGQPLALSMGFVATAVRVTEGNSGTKMAELTVALNQVSATDISVRYATANSTAIAGSDYTVQSRTLVIPAGSTQGTIQIPILGDTVSETDESFTVTLSAATGGALIAPAVATVTIANDDGSTPLPSIRISNPSVIEGNSGSPKLSFVISLAKAVTATTVLTVSTVDGTAKAGKDYVAFSGPVTILAGRSSATVTVAVLPNRIVDGNRTLSLKVSSGSTTLATGVGTIRDDDRAPRTLSRQTSQFSVAAAFASYSTATTTTTVKKK